MRIAFLIFDDLTTLDAIGPFEVLCRIPGAEVMFVGETAGIKRADPKSLGIVADYSIADVTTADILVVPGGRGEAQVREKPRMLEWIRQIDKTTQVDDLGLHRLAGARRCGPAQGTARNDPLGATRKTARVRRRAAESARRRGRQDNHGGGSLCRDRHGIHLARRVAGDTVAQAIQVGIEYDPQPPFDGNSQRAPAEVLEVLRPRYQRT